MTLASFQSAVLLISLPVLLHEFISPHLQLPDDSLDALIIELGDHALAAVGPASTLHGLKGAGVQETGSFVWTGAVGAGPQRAELGSSFMTERPVVEVHKSL